MPYRFFCTACLMATVGLAQNSLMAGSNQGERFEQLTVKRGSTYQKPTSNVPLGLGEAYLPTGGRFVATNFDLLSYISFAYQLTPSQRKALMKQAPSWIMYDRYDIEAQSSDPAARKDDMRELMRSLLADRFQLAMHKEKRAGTMYALQLITPGKPGPNLTPHPPGQLCPTRLQIPATSRGRASGVGIRMPCGSLVGYFSPDGNLLAGRDVPISLVATEFSRFEECAPVVDETGLSGRYDLTLQYSTGTTRRFGEYAGSTGGGGNGTAAPGVDDDLDELVSAGERNPDALDEEHEPPKVKKALASELGMKLVKERGDFDVWVIDHVTRPPLN